MNKVRTWLYIGDLTSGRTAIQQGHPQAVLSVTSHYPDFATTDHSITHAHVSLTDDNSNSQQQFNEAVREALRLLEDAGELLIHCSAGISRSAAVTATVLATKENIGFDEAVSELKTVKPNVHPNPDLRELALTRLGDDPSPFSNTY